MRVGWGANTRRRVQAVCQRQEEGLVLTASERQGKVKRRGLKTGVTRVGTQKIPAQMGGGARREAGGSD